MHRGWNGFDHLADGPALLVGEVRHEEWSVFPSLSQRPCTWIGDT